MSYYKVNLVFIKATSTLIMNYDNMLWKKLLCHTF